MKMKFKNSHLTSYLCLTCTGLDVRIEIPRRCGRQLYRVNTPASTPEEYFRVAVFIPFLDSYLMQMNERLLAHRSLLTCFSSLLPRKETCLKGLDSDALRQVSVLHTTYSKHLECGEIEFIGEMKLYYQHISKLENVPRNALNALQVPEFFPMHHASFIIMFYSYSELTFLVSTTNTTMP